MSNATKEQLDYLYPDYLGVQIREKDGLIMVYHDNKGKECHVWVENNGRLEPAPRKS